MKSLYDLKGMSWEEIGSLVSLLEERPFRAKQLFRWIHQKGASSFDCLSDLPISFRKRLQEVAFFRALEVDCLRKSMDGSWKIRFRTADGHGIESVYLPEERRRTLCVSTQVGCAMGCAFCRTASMGLIRHLETSEILDQVYQVNRLLFQEGIKSLRPLTNLVFMGMGEPLHNYAHVKKALNLLQHEEGCNFSHRHLTISTSGIVPEMERLAKETFVKLAVSLNATTDQQRNQLMPVNRRWNIQQLLQACRAFPTRQGRRVTFEYIMLDGVNDSLDDARRLVQWLKPMPVKVNIIPYNENPGLPFRCSPQRRIEEFQQCLLSHGVATITRKSRGRDIAAACGQLAMSE